MAAEGGYDSFISYSHAADRATARALQRTLHRLGRPWYRRTALRVFRDDTTLAASPDLWGSIERALRSARTLVLLASPESASSAWVGREVELWRRERSRDTFLIALTAGELAWDAERGDFDPERSTALPGQLHGWFDVEPFWVDLRGCREAKRQKEFRDRAAAIAAAVHGEPKDALLSTDAQQQRRLVALLSTLLVLAVVAGIVAVWQLRTAVAERERADEQARIALSRALAAESDVQADADPRLAAQLAIAAYAARPTSEADGALLRELDHNRHLIAYVRRGTDQVSTQRFASSLTPTHVALTPDGALLAVAHLDERAVTLWDVAQSRAVARLRTDPPAGSDDDYYSASFGLSFSADGRVLAVDDGTRVQIWDVPRRALVRVIDGAGGGSHLALSPDGRLIARIGDRRRGEPPVLMWRADTGARIAVPSPPSVVASVLVTFDAAGGLVAQLRNGMYRFDAGAWTVLVPFTANRPHAFALSRDPRQLVVATDDGLEAWDLATRRRVVRRAVAGAGGIGLASIAVAADGTTVVYGDGAGRVVATNLATGRGVELARHRQPVSDLAMSADGGVVASISDDGDALLSTPDHDHRLVAGAAAPDYGSGKDGERRRTVTTAVIGRRGDLAAVVRWGGVEMWDLAGLRMRTRVALPDVESVAVSADQRTFAALAGERLVVGDTRSGRVSATFAVESPKPPALAGSEAVRFTPDGDGVLVDTDGGPAVFDLRTGAVRQQLATADGGGFAANADASRVVVVEEALTPQAGGTRFGVWRWRGSEYEKVGLLQRPALAVDVELSPDGTRFAVLDIDGRVIGVELSDIEPSTVLRSASGTGEISFATDGATLARGVDTGGIMLWDMLGERQLGVWPDELGGASSTVLDVGPGGLALTARPDGSLALWRIRVADALSALCDLAGELADEDRTRYVRDVEVARVCRD